MAQAQLEITTDAGTLDLIQGTEETFFVTRQIFDLNNFETRNSDFTQFVTLPTTPNNISILNTAADVTNQAARDAEKIKCSIKFNGITIAPIAWIIIGGTIATKDAIIFEAIIMYGNFNIIDELSGRSIKDINWADTHTLWEVADLVIKSENTFADNDLVFPIADWQTRSAESWNAVPGGTGVYYTYDINVAGFFLYARNIIERAIAERGYTLVVGETVPLDFDKIALACHMGMFLDVQEPGSESPLSATTVNSINQVVDGVVVKATFQIVTNDPDDLWDTANQQYLIPINTPSQGLYMTVEGLYDHNKGVGNPPDSTIILLQNGSPIDSIAISLNQSSVPFFLSATVPGNAGDIFHVELSGGKGPNPVGSVLTLQVGTEFKLVTEGTSLGRTVRTEEWMPDIQQSTFIANICKLYNLFMVTDDVERTVTLTSFNGIYFADEIDLSGRLSAGDNAIDISYALPSLGRASSFKWNNDDLLRNDTNVIVEFKGALLEDSKTVIEMAFSACDNSTLFFNAANGNVFQKAKIPMVEYHRTAGGGATISIAADGTFVVTNTVQITFDTNYFFEVRQPNVGGGTDSFLYRVIQVNSAEQPESGVFQTPVFETLFGDATIHAVYKVSSQTFDDRLAIIRSDGGEDKQIIQNGSPATQGSFNVASLTANWMDSLRMRNVVEGQYRRILNSLSSQQVIRAKFQLSALLVLNLDLRRPVYISTFNGFYYINKIDQFKITELTTLELIRISAIEEPL